MICIECRADGKRQVVTYRFGAWNCPIHRDRGHVMEDCFPRSAEQIAPPVRTPETDAAPPEGDDTKLIMLAGAIKAWWMHHCELCGRFYDNPTRCYHTGTHMRKKPRCKTAPMWDSPLHRQYLVYRRDLQAALIATNRYLTYSPNMAFKGRWFEKAQAVNDKAIEISDLMVVMSPPNVPTDGTDAEAIVAAEYGTSVLYVPCTQFSAQGALSTIDEFFSIKSEIDSDIDRAR